MLHSHRLFDPEPATREVASEIYQEVENLPILSPHGHTEACWFAENQPFSNPTDLIITPDHYIFRLLYSQRISLESLGISPLDGSGYEKDKRKIWQTFGDNYYLFAGTPTGMWLDFEFEKVFGVMEKLTSDSAMTIYDQIADKLEQPEFLPRSLFEKFQIEVISTTDGACDTLEHHQQLVDLGWAGKVIPCFRPDDVTNLLHPRWQENIQRLSSICDMNIESMTEFLQALKKRRDFFRKMGATATDHGVESPFTEELSASEAERIFQKALQEKVSASENRQFTGHMLMKMAEMSCEDGLVMQIHPGSFRNHHHKLWEKFGPDKGADIPLAVDFTKNLHPLLNKFGSHSNFTLIVFTLDETTYSRELAPLAGHYPAMHIGPAWWFHDSFQGMKRFREQVWETASIYNTTSFIDDTRAFPSIPARHDVARRIDCNFLAGMVVRHIIDLEDAKTMAKELAYGLSKRIYKL